ncbi:hypothetical protein F2981_13970 [Sinorhizobium meliloti]|nr:hypothetical protein [Sinorhizobium meliloti]
MVGFDGDTLVVEFEDGKHRVGPSEIDKLALAYCISVHKAQGSQFKNVVMSCSLPPTWTEPWSTTAVTARPTESL